jgi:RNA polymerase sigma-70 factor (ECF subfamily)
MTVEYEIFTLNEYRQPMKEHDPGSDSLLIARFLSGDKTAFEALINQYRQKLYSYLYRMVSNSEAAKDLFQDAIVNVLKALPKYREQQKFSNWLFSNAHNLAMNYIQKQKQKSAIILENSFSDTDRELLNAWADESFSPEEIMKKKELQEILKSSIEKLAIEQKQILLLREYSGLPFKEIELMLDCPLNTMLGRMRYTLLNLRKIVHQETGGDISNVL